MDLEEILSLHSLIDDMRKRALQRKEEIWNDPTSEESEKRYAEQVIKFLSIEEYFNRVPKSIVFAVFSYLGYSFDDYMITTYNRMYYKVMEEANRVYKLVDPESLQR